MPLMAGDPGPARDKLGLLCGCDSEAAGHSAAHGYLLPMVAQIIERLDLKPSDRRIFELGCGNGSAAAFLAGRGFEVVGVDTSAEAIRIANQAYPALQLTRGSAYDDLAAGFGQFPVVTSLEVVEHVYYPRLFARCLFSLLQPGGMAIISTPYHGYWKNLALAVTGQMDAHFTALWDGGHIKFWSRRTIGLLLKEAGFRQIEFRTVGRVPPLAKSMIVTGKR
jgi:2-polyprenyl-3-methyl-5-hydroxy-6-metoxy-1,4-benzoquinol methylase